ncbi:inactive polyglycylase TTLL10 isoform X2 [Sagmatias obliquidens]|uniref:inactive polyglycylase TTLL10 isoform X2 n=2 Tax=Sagmatias obliquidens TaxID=3371155 RepID=UPI000F444D06|nr:inactive polyglycylase TTLL10 isoform X2 [Lagenorhynchus obliquidens]XP_026966398.1 inactive polyglycylase TTLL10 isoform X2 [Lagenorhynchus obliquidens]XP_026966400.1 inactive polyglycylase TTLL10 isoform X2 [Lagenorhynchus obliquidens]XP_026966401.1 inactive polyglycylase TTLL10 isoform X2 [Lagenorhynchus obliquidens]XP_026966402.1 inactive polyglycylase TTLL10 isoform X2 [Lagenorhynchus obliquidens]
MQGSGGQRQGAMQGSQRPSHTPWPPRPGRELLSAPCGGTGLLSAHFLFCKEAVVRGDEITQVHEGLPFITPERHFPPDFLPDQPAGRPSAEMPTPDGQSLQAPQSPQRREPPTRGSPNPGRWAAPLPGQGGPDCVPSSRARTTGRPKGPQRGGGHVFPEVPPHQCPSACGPQPHPLPPLPGTTSSDPELDDADTARPRAALLEKHPLEGEKQRPGTGQGPFFYIGGTNGAAIISSYCKSKGWQRIQDSRREDYKLKWCEVKCRDTYCSFREGEQLLYQLPNSQLLTTKIGLLSALREHARVLSKTSKLAPCAQAKSGKDTTPAPEELMWSSSGHLGPQSVLKMEDFFPETYRLDIRDEREAFFTLFDALSAETQMWICKPTASNQGKGIFLLRNQEEVAALQAKTQSIEDDPIYRKMPFRAPQARVVQRFCAWAPRGALARYIQNPLLLDGKKFDVRSYLLIACTMPYMVFFGHGYARLTLGLYDPQSSDLCGHLTNQFMQKKSPLYLLLKDDTVWSMEHLNRHINDKFRKAKRLPRDWVFTTFAKRMQQIMAHCFLSVKSKLKCKLGYFDLIGCDFLIDENFKVWLLEMSSNPALHTNCEVLKETWHSRPSRRGCAARRCCRCCPSATSCSCTTARQTCGRAPGAPAASPARRRRRPPRPPLSAPPAGRARAGPHHAGAPAARPGGPPPHSGAPGLRPPAPTAPRAGTPRPRAAGSRRGSLPRGRRRRSARTRATGALAGAYKSCFFCYKRDLCSWSAGSPHTGPRDPLRQPPCAP